MNSTYSQQLPTGDSAPSRPAPAALASPPSWESLRGYSTLLRGVLDAVPFGIAVLGQGGSLTIWNDELSAMLPAPPSRGGQHDLSTLIREVRRIVGDPDDFEVRLHQAVANPAAGAEFERGATEFEVRDLVHKIGARAIETVVNERKKGGTKGRA